MKPDKERLFQDILWLTSVSPHRNFWNPDVLFEVAEYTIERFNSLGLNPQIQCFQADGEAYRNVFASIGKPTADRIIIGANYDVCGGVAGADANASGFAGMLELARMLTATEVTLNYRIDFVAYGLTEAPFFGTDLMGSLQHIKQLQAEDANIHSMIALSGIGYFTNEPNSQEYPILALTAKHSNVGNFIGISCLSEQSEWFRQLYKSMKQTTEVPVEFLTYPTNNDNVGMADHRCFLRNGYRAAMIGNGGANRNPNYHQIPDTIDTLDFDRMSELLKGVYGFLVEVQ